MSTNSRWWFVDLVVALSLTVLGGYVAYMGLDGRLRVALVLPLVVFLPGYVLVSAIFPGGGEDGTRQFGIGESDASYALGGPERVALAVTLSVAIVPMIAAVANFTPWGVTLRPILVGIVAFTGFFTLVALVRRVRVPAKRRYSPGAPGVLFSSTGRRSDSGTTTLLNVGIVISFLLVASSVGFAVLNPPQGEQFTEFYVDTQNIDSNTNTLYQTDLGGDGVTVNVGNHEGERVQYTVVAVLERVENGNVVQQSQFAEEQVTVDQGQTKKVTLQGDPSISGDNVRLRLLLYKGDPSGNPYLTTRLWLSQQNAPIQDDTTDEGSNDGGEGDDGGDDDESGDGEQTTEPPQTTRTQTSTTSSTTTSPSTTTTSETTSETTISFGTTTSETTTDRTTTTARTTTSETTSTTTTDDGFLPDRDPNYLNDR